MSVPSIIARALFPRVKRRARTGDPLSIGLVVLWMLYRYFKSQSSKSGYSTKLLPGESITISNISKSVKK